jgi:hypothetical protein
MDADGPLMEQPSGYRVFVIGEYKCSLEVQKTVPLSHRSQRSWNPNEKTAGDQSPAVLEIF